MSIWPDSQEHPVRAHARRVMTNSPGQLRPRGIRCLGDLLGRPILQRGSGPGWFLDRAIAVVRGVCDGG